MFGKIPARADFVRLGEASPAIDAFDDLSQRALQSRPPDRAAPPYRAIVVPPRGPHAIVGAMHLSRDTIGRAYPVVAGRTVSRLAANVDTLPAWPLRWGAVLDGSAALVGMAGRGAPADTLDNRLWGLPTVAPTGGRSSEVDAHVRALQALPARALWTRIWGNPEPDPMALAASRLSKTAPGPISYGLRFSLPRPTMDFTSADAASFWLTVCWHLLPKPTSAPTLFWTDGPPAALYVFFGDVSAAAFRAVLTGVSNTDRIVSVDDGPASAMLRASYNLSPSFRLLLNEPEATVSDILDGLGTLR